jgi:hypothetical protein
VHHLKIRIVKKFIPHDPEEIEQTLTNYLDMRDDFLAELNQGEDLPSKVKTIWDECLIKAGSCYKESVEVTSSF